MKSDNKITKDSKNYMKKKKPCKKTFFIHVKESVELLCTHAGYWNWCDNFNFF